MSGSGHFEIDRIERPRGSRSPDRSGENQSDKRQAQPFHRDLPSSSAAMKEGMAETYVASQRKDDGVGKRP
jgi:hypothetical protein